VWPHLHYVLLRVELRGSCRGSIGGRGIVVVDWRGFEVGAVVRVVGLLLGVVECEVVLRCLAIALALAEGNEPL
jgi:hypothetical protein